MRCVGRPRVRTSKPLMVHANVHGLRWTKLRFKNERDGHGIKQRRRFLAPLVIQQSERVRNRRALAKEEVAIRSVHFQLSGIEWHHEQRHARSKQYMR